MNNYKDLQEANKEVERSKAILHDSEIAADGQRQEVENSEIADTEAKEEGSGIFTADGKELPKVDGGYDLIEPGGTLGDDEFIST